MSSFFTSVFSRREQPGIRLIVFDFDGTLADTKELIKRIIRTHVASFNLSLGSHLLQTLGNTPLRDYLSTAGLAKEFIQSVATAIEENFTAEYKSIKPCTHLLTIKSLPIRKVIVSNNYTQFIEKTLHFWHANFFDGVYGADRFTDKPAMIKRLCKQYHCDPQEVMYVGDKSVDVLVARQAGCYSVIVSSPIAWSTYKEVIAEHPDFIVRDIGRLATVIQSINMVEIPRI